MTGFNDTIILVNHNQKTKKKTKNKIIDKNVLISRNDLSYTEVAGSSWYHFLVLNGNSSLRDIQPNKSVKMIKDKAKIT